MERGGTQQSVEELSAEVAGLRASLADHERISSELRESEQKYRAIFENLHDTYYRTDNNGNLAIASPSGERIFGYAVGEVIGKNLAQDFYVDPARREEFLRLLRQTGSVREFEARLKRKDGSIIWVSTNATFCRDADGNVVGVEGISRDITERKENDERLRRMQKLEAIGALAGSVAHDFSNLLTSIMGYASILQLRGASDPQLGKAAGVILKSAQRASELTKQLLALARRGKLENVPVDMHAAVNRVIAVLARQADERIRIRSKLEAANCIIHGDSEQLHQALLHLGTNACEAMADGGELVFETQLVELDEEYRLANPNSVTGRHIALNVADTGTGIPAEVGDRVFQPFFTTKSGEQYLGLGLPMTFGIVRNHSGSISFESEPGHGTTFTVLLPLAEG